MMNDKGYMKNAKQFRDRWINYVDPNLRKVPLNEFEITQLFNFYYQFGSSWSLISKMMDNASPNMLKNTFYKEVNIIIKNLKLNFLNFKSEKNAKLAGINVYIDLYILEKLSLKFEIPINKLKSIEKNKLLNEIKSLRYESTEKNSFSKFYKESPIIEPKDEIHKEQETKNENENENEIQIENKLFDLLDDKDKTNHLLCNQIENVFHDNDKIEKDASSNLQEENNIEYNEIIDNMSTNSERLSNLYLHHSVIDDKEHCIIFQQDFSRLYGSPQFFRNFEDYDLFKFNTF